VHASLAKHIAIPDRINGTSTFSVGVQVRTDKNVLGNLSCLISILPIPNGLQELHHVDTFALHLNHPRVVKHAPRCRTAIGLFFKAVEKWSV
jgi:hypothetical protein